LKSTITAQFHPLDNGLPVAIHLWIEGEINTIQSTATINIRINKTKYRLRTAQISTNAAVSVVKQSLNYTVTQNWPALYNLLSTDIKATTSPAQFTQLMSSSPRIIAADLNGQGQMKTNSGYNYFMQPVTLTVRQPNGSTAIYHDNEFFVLENGSWRFLSTDSPKL
jgi:hypothetical protein